MAAEDKLTEAELLELIAYDNLGELPAAEIDAYRKRAPSLTLSLKLHAAWTEQVKAREAASQPPAPATGASPAGAAATPPPAQPEAESDKTAAVVADATGTDTRAKLVRFFRHHGKEDKLTNVDAILEGYAGDEAGLWRDLVDKYGPGPEAYGVAAAGGDTAEGELAAQVPTRPAPRPARPAPAKKEGMRGTLRKMALGRRLFGRASWKPRFFVLDPDSPSRLYYYESDADAMSHSSEAKEKAKGSIPLDRNGALLVDQPTKEHHPEANPNLQQLMVVFDEGKQEMKLLLCAEDDEDARLR